MAIWLVFFSILALGGEVKAADYDVYEAKAAGADSASAPVVVFVHGGAWVSGSRSQYRALGEALAAQKICSVIVGYPLAPASKHPKQVEALQKNINELTSQKSGRCSWDRVWLMGHSAGAHMIGMWNATYDNPAVRGFIGLEGIYDLENLLKVWPGYKDWFVKKAFGDDASKYAAASPRQLKMKSRAPWLVVHSEKDELVDMAQSTDFVTALEKQGVKAELLRLQTGTHFEVVDDVKNSSSAVAKKIAAFVRP